MGSQFFSGIDLNQEFGVSGSGAFFNTEARSTRRTTETLRATPCTPCLRVEKILIPHECGSKSPASSADTMQCISMALPGIHSDYAPVRAVIFQTEN